jgi:predicted nucleotidyltransferase
MCTRETLHTVLNKLYDRLKQIYGNDLDTVLLYGSYARGDYNEYSDIDVMVLVNCEDERIKELDRELCPFESRLCIDYDVDLSVYTKNREYFDYWKDSMPYFRSIATEGVEIGA